MNDRKKVLELFDTCSTVSDQTVRDGIEKNRKGTATLTVTDRNGQAIPHAKLRLTQQTHEFRFGANCFLLDEMETKEKNEAYKRYFADVFNMATLPFYWDALEPQRGQPRYAKDSPKVYRRPSPDLCMEFCEQYGIEPREHALAYDHFFPKWLANADTAEVKRELERRYAEIAARYGDKIRTIEVTNEMVWRHGRTAFYDDPDFVRWCFETAETYFPNNQLVINECTGLAWEKDQRVTDQYYAYIENAILKGARIDAIGMQYHLFYRREDEYAKTRISLDPDCLYRSMDLYARFGKPLQVTEVTVPAYSWEDEDEEMQAEILGKLYPLWFSHPNVEQIIYWNLVDGYAHVEDATPEKIRATQGDMTLGENYYHGGLLRFDMTPKPAYRKLQQLITQEWHTEADAVTDANGTASFRGFYGQYRAEIVTERGSVTKAVSLSSRSDNHITVTVDADGSF